MDINLRVAQQIGRLRMDRRLRIEDLAARSGVSRAMISRIERGETSASVGTLEKISIGLGVLLPELFGRESYGEPRLHRRNPVVSRRGQPEWVDAACGYRRRTLTPATATQPMRLFEVCLSAGARVMLEFVPGNSPAMQQVWILEGNVELGLGGQTLLLRTGDRAALEVDHPTHLRNPGAGNARYLSAVLSNLPCSRKAATCAATSPDSGSAM